MNKKKLKIVAIIQTRMGSTRLPGKSMQTILGKPLLFFCIERLRLCQLIDQIVVATTNHPRDRMIVDFCRKMQVPCYIGSEENVLERYYQTALTFQADGIVRITGDCPLNDPEVIDRAIQIFLQNYPQYDYVSNVIKRTYPRGLDVEVFSMNCLEKMYRYATTPDEKEHVTAYLLRHLDRFKTYSLTHHKDLSIYRWTVDTSEDFHLISRIIESVYPENKTFSFNDILKLYELHPEWYKINDHIHQKEIYP